MKKTCLIISALIVLLTGCSDSTESMERSTGPTSATTIAEESTNPVDNEELKSTTAYTDVATSFSASKETQTTKLIETTTKATLFTATNQPSKTETTSFGSSKTTFPQTTATEQKPKESSFKQKTTTESKPQTFDTTKSHITFDVDYWIGYAKNYAQSKGLVLDAAAVDCWDNPIRAGSYSIYLERDIQSRLNRYANDEDITDVWIWAESVGNECYDIYIGYA